MLFTKYFRKNKKKVILEFKDQFAPYPDLNPKILEVEQEIKRIRKVNHGYNEANEHPDCVILLMNE